MNKEEILAMEAGKSLNMLIAEKVMGLIAWEEKRGGYTHIVFQKPEDNEPYKRNRNWEKEMDRYKRIEYSEINNHIHVVQEIKSYSSDISAAWEVVESMKKLNWWVVLSIADDKWNALFYWDPEQEAFESQSSLAPEAICKAALLAVMDS